MNPPNLIVYHSRRGALEAMLTEAVPALGNSWEHVAVTEAPWPSPPPRLLVLAGSIQAGKLHPKLLLWAENHAAQMSGIPLALITCGLMQGKQGLAQAESAWGQALWAAAGEHHLLLPGFLNTSRVNPLLRWMIGRMMPNPPQSVNQGVVAELGAFLGALRA